LKDCQITLTKKTKKAAKVRKQTPESFNWKKILVYIIKGNVPVIKTISNNNNFLGGNIFETIF
jgi:hypothetical protein